MAFVFNLTGCSHYGSLDGNITTYNDDLIIEPGTTISVISGENEKQNSLEFKFCQNLLAGHLEKANFKVVSIDDKENKPHMVAVLSYNMGKGKKDINTRFDPFLGNVITTKILYNTSVKIEIKSLADDANLSNLEKAKVLYSSVISTKSEYDDLNLVFPQMLEMHFKKFPRNNASTQKETITFPMED